MKRLLKWLFTIALVLAILFGCCFGVSKVISMNAGNINIVIVGIDSREGLEGARSDTIMIAHIDENHKNAKLVSIPRDSYVYIPSVAYEDKINHAYAYDGLNGLLTTLDSLFDNSFEYYVEVDFLKMIALVDVIDGIELTPTSSFCEMNEVDVSDAYCFEEGVSLHLDGNEALAYARHRKSDSDLFRAARQQEVVKAMISKVKQSDPLTILKFYREFQEISNTNLSFLDFIRYSDLLYNDFVLTQEVAEGYSDTLYSSMYDQYLSYYFIDENWLQYASNEFKK